MVAREAEGFARGKEGRQMNQLGTSAVKSNRELVEAFLRFIEARGRSQRTIVAYRQIVGDFVESLGPIDCRVAAPATIRSYFADRLAMGRGQASLFVYNCAVRAFYSFLGRAGAIRRLPRIVPTKQVRRIPDALTEKQIEQLMSAPASLRDHALLELLYATGLRVSEAANLRLEDVLWEENLIMVRNGKGGKDRAVPFGSKAEVALKQYLAESHESEYVFERPSGKGSVQLNRKTQWNGFCYSTEKRTICRYIGTVDKFPTRESAMQEWQRRLKTIIPNYKPPRPAGKITARALHGIVAKIGRRIGLKISPHAFRHSIATHLLSRCRDIRVVQEFLGHSSVSTTAIYTHVGIDDLKATHQKFHPHARETKHEEKANATR